MQAGGGTWTPHAKRLRARLMFGRGQNLLAAAVLLERHGGDGFAVLYLLCQSVEVVLKALLILRDYEKHKPGLRGFGHNLAKLAGATSAEFGLNALRPPLKAELDALNRLYANTVYPLRYASFLDLLVDPSTVPRFGGQEDGGHLPPDGAGACPVGGPCRLGRRRVGRAGPGPSFRRNGRCDDSRSALTLSGRRGGTPPRPRRRRRGSAAPCPALWPDRGSARPRRRFRSIPGTSA